MNVRLPKDEATQIANRDDIARIMQKILMRQNRINRQKEYFWTIGLNTANDIQYIELVALGKLNAVAVDPTEVFHIAVSKKCKKIVLVHNHPSGNTEASEADKRVTKELTLAAKILKIEILDHIIITEDSFSSIIDKI